MTDDLLMLRHLLLVLFTGLASLGASEVEAPPPEPVALNATAQRAIDLFAKDRERADGKLRTAKETWQTEVLRARNTAVAALKRSIRATSPEDQQVAVLREVLRLDPLDANARAYFTAREELDGVLAEVEPDALQTDILGNLIVTAAADAGNVALASRGATVTGEGINHPEILLDGNKTAYDGSSGFTDSTWPCAWVIDLVKAQPLREVRFLLWDGDQRFYRYRLEASDDGEHWGLAKDASEGEYSSWQRIELKGRPLRYLRLHGLFNSVNTSFHVVEFEAYNLPPKE